MAITVNTDLIDVQVLVDAVRGVFKGKNAFMGSVLASQGAVRVSGTMGAGPSAIAKKIDIPYFGTIGKFVNNPDGSAVTPQKLQQVLEQATVGRVSLAAETSRWAQGVGAIDPAVGDPHQEAANQVHEQATRAMDELCVAEAATTPLISDVYSATTPVYVDWDLYINSKTMWGDEQDNIVAMVVHSTSLADMATLKNGHGDPLLLMNQSQGQEDVIRFAGVPVLVSDLVPLTGSTMGAVTSAGTSPPVLTITGVPLGPWKLMIDCVLGGAHQTATYRFSTDGGNTWSATITTLAAAATQPLIDTAADSLVGMNGATGLSVAFAAGTFNADNTWKSQANLKVTDLMLQRDALAFWYNQQRLGAQSDVDILADADIIAMHLYHATKLYRRRRGGSRPGCIAVKHNIKNYIGAVTF